MTSSYLFRDTFPNLWRIPPPDGLCPRLLNDTPCGMAWSGTSTHARVSYYKRSAENSMHLEQSIGSDARRKLKVKLPIYFGLISSGSAHQYSSQKTRSEKRRLESRNSNSPPFFDLDRESIDWVIARRRRCKALSLNARVASPHLAPTHGVRKRCGRRLLFTLHSNTFS